MYSSTKYYQEHPVYNSRHWAVLNWVPTTIDSMHHYCSARYILNNVMHRACMYLNLVSLPSRSHGAGGGQAGGAYNRAGSALCIICK